MSGVAVVASTHDAKFAEEVRAALQAAGLDASISQSLPKAASSHVVLIWSAALEVGHVIDAQALIGLWSEDRLVTVRRDETPLPLGLRDLPSLPPGSTVAQICAAVPGVRYAAGNVETAPRAGTPVGIIVAAIIAIALAGGGAWYYFNKSRIEKQAALTMALESATKATQELREAHVRELEALRALEQARAAENAARKAGDQEKLKEAQEATKRADAEAAKQAEAVKQREAAAADARKKAQESAGSAKKAAAKASVPEKVAVAAVAPKAEAPKAVAKAPEPVTKPPEPVSKAVEPQKPKTRSERERKEEDLLARQAALKKGVAVSAAPSQPSASAEPVASSASSASAPALPSAEMFQQAKEMESSDPRGAVRIYRSLARNGSGAAAKRLGEIFDKGIPGILRDYAESLQWYETARKLGETVEMAGRREGGPTAVPSPAPAPPIPAIVKSAPAPERPVSVPTPAPAKPAAKERAVEAPKAAPAPPPATAALPEAPKAAAPAPSAVAVPEPQPAAEPAAPAQETKTGWFTWRGLLIALFVLALIAWRRSRRRKKAAARLAERQSVAAIGGSSAQAAVLIATLSESASPDSTAIDKCVRIMRRCIEAAKGRVVRTKGGEVVSLFASADAAADAAIQMQEAIHELKPIGNTKIGIRIGFNCGPIVEQGGGEVSGDTVDVASRLSRVAVKGQIVTARDTVMRMSPMLKSATRKITAIQLKDKAEEVDVFELMWQQSEDASTMAAARQVYRPGKAAGQAVPGDSMLFVSYSHKDRPRVDPIVSVIEDMGRRVWMDRSDITGQTGWAGQIVRAIRECRAVVLMASPNSYNSDQVVRELYLAMNHRKTIVPIEIEPAEMPDELQYILAPFQHHRLSAGETRAVLGRALAAV